MGSRSRSRSPHSARLSFNLRPLCRPWPCCWGSPAEPGRLNALRSRVGAQPEQYVLVVEQEDTTICLPRADERPDSRPAPNDPPRVAEGL